jgi:opacity protein-like surface antigen
VAVKATERATIDFGYSFTHLGKARSGDLVAGDGSNFVDNPMHFNQIRSHDIKVGLRYAFN